MSELKQCECPCHKEGLWKLPDEIVRLKELLKQSHDRISYMTLQTRPITFNGMTDEEFMSELREAAK